MTRCAMGWLHPVGKIISSLFKTLEQAIDQHRKQLAQWSIKVEQAVKYWQEKQQRLNAFETLQERAETTQRQQENRLDQKLMDEFAQRASQRSLNL